jgi:hypothetical protein
MVLLLVLYPLSVGPVFVGAVHTENLSIAIPVEYFYLPLFFGCAMTGQSEILEDYIDWWSEILGMPI